MITPGTRPSRYPLSAAQRGVWLGQRLDPESPCYWTAELLELNGVLDVRVLEEALLRTVAETESLALRYQVTEALPWQQRGALCFVLERLELTAVDADIQTARRLCLLELTTPADLEQGPVFGAKLLRLTEHKHALFLRAHHLALDGFGFYLFEARLMQQYAALLQGRELEARTASVYDVVLEDQKYRASPAFERDREFWLERLTGQSEPAVLSKPSVLARDVRRARSVLDLSFFERLKSSAAALRVEFSAYVIAVVAAWMSRQTGETELVFGLPVTARLASVGAQTPCMMMNILALRVAVLKQDTLESLVRRVSNEVYAVRPHQRYRYEDLKHDLRTASGRRRLFGAVINLMPFDAGLDVAGLEVTIHPVASGPVEDWSLSISPRKRGCSFDIEANPNSYSADTLETQRESLACAFEEFFALPGSALLASYLTQGQAAAEPSKLVGEALLQPAHSVLERLLEATAVNGSKHAIEQDGAAPLDYSAFVEQVRGLAATLVARGVGANRRVAVYLERSPLAIVAQFAVLWAGGGYVPLEPDGPAERRTSLLANAAPEVVLTTRQYAADVAAWHPLILDELETDLPSSDELLAPVPVPESSLAYIVYTSGSTGEPHGVVISRAALAHFVAAAEQRYAIQASDRVLQFAPLKFDASVEEIFLSLSCGATLVLRTSAMLESMGAFLGACRRLRITLLDLPTAFFHELALALGPSCSLPESVRLVIIGGEAALGARVQRFRDAIGPHVTLQNSYGPTETTVVCTTSTLIGTDALPASEALISIGRPLAGLSAFVVDAEGYLVPRGTAGELCIVGPTLADGYWQREEASAAHFAQLPGIEARAYRTGDRVLLAENGELYFLGRNDDELKISGIRVHPREVEAALLKLNGVVEAAVISNTAVQARLDAFLVLEGTEKSDAQLRAELAVYLAPQAIPAAVFRLARLPRDSNGKLDRKALRAETVPVPQVHTSLTPSEALVHAVFCEVLGVDTIDRHADFFESGGHSLLALRVVSQLSQQIARELPLSALFLSPTISSFAPLIDAHFLEAQSLALPQVAFGNPLAAVLTLQHGTGPALFCIHPADGLSWCYLGICRHLPDVPLIGIQAPGLLGQAPESFTETVACYLALLREQQASGPYYLLGWSSGGGIAHALAVELQRAGEQVALLAMLDAHPADIWQGVPEATEQDALVSMLDDLDASATDPAGRPYTSAELMQRLKRPESALSSFDEATLWRMCRVAQESMRTYRQAKHGLFAGDVLYFRASQRSVDAPDTALWERYVDGVIECVAVPANHLAMCQRGALEVICGVLRDRIPGR